MLDNLFKEPLDKKQTFFIFLGIGGVILILWGYFLLFPQGRSLIRILGKSGRIRADIIANKADIDRIDIFKRKLTEYKERVAYYEGQFPKKGDIPSIVESLSDMARESAVKIASITPLKASETRTAQLGGFYLEIPVLISARSGYHELGSFINKIESSGFFMKIADIEIKSNEQMPKRHDCELLILTYAKNE